MTVSPSATTPPDTVPVMPEAARLHTKEGAEAFVRYFWDVVNYAQATGDTERLQELSAVGCQACDAGIAGIKKVYADGGQISGGENLASNVAATVFTAGTATFAKVTFTLRVTKEVDRYPSPAAPKSAKARSERLTATLNGVAAGWLTAQFGKP